MTPHDPAFPQIRHIAPARAFRSPEPLERLAHDQGGNHLVLGRRAQDTSPGGLIFFGKCIEHTTIADRFGANVWIDYARPHIVFIAGKRGSGKSYDLGVIAEGLGKPEGSNIWTLGPPVATIVFDTQNQFWTLSFAPHPDLHEDSDQVRDLQAWGIQPGQTATPNLLVPAGSTKYLGSEQDFQIDPSEVSADDWCAMLGVDRFSPQGHLLQRTHRKVVRDGWTWRRGDGTTQAIGASNAYTLDDLVNCVRYDDDNLDDFQSSTIDATAWRLESLAESHLFGSTAAIEPHLLSPNTVTVFMLRDIEDSIKSLVVAVVLRKIFSIMGPRHVATKVARRQGKEAELDQSVAELVWILIDEAHLVCPADKPTSAKPVIIDFVKRGRDAGLSLVLATQQPAAVDTAVLSQADLSIVHRLVTDADISAAVARLPASMPAGLKLGNREFPDARGLLRYLEAGEAVVADAEASRAFLTITRPRVAAHGGADPIVSSPDANI